MSDRRTDAAEDTPDPHAPGEPQDSPGEPQDSVMGSLPRSRPSVRSPRRDAAARAREARAEKAAGAKPAPSKPLSEAPAEDEGGGLGEVARAGVTTAAQVATAGLRFAGRAAGAIRESLERR